MCLIREKKDTDRIAQMKKFPESTLSTPKRKAKECDLPNDLRCTRSDPKKNWRCAQPRFEGMSFCEHHTNLQRAHNQARKERLRQKNIISKESQDVTAEGLGDIGPIAFPILTNENNNAQLQPGNQNVVDDSQVLIAITKRCMNNSGVVRISEISRKSIVPSQVYELEDLSGIVTMDVWDDYFSPAERYCIRSLLPEGEKSEKGVAALLSGQCSRFGMDPVNMWGTSVCDGETHPSRLLRKETELNRDYSKYMECLERYHEAFICTADELKQLFFGTCHGDDTMFRKELKKQLKEYQD